MKNRKTLSNCESIDLDQIDSNIFEQGSTTSLDVEADVLSWLDFDDADFSVKNVNEISKDQHLLDNEDTISYSNKNITPIDTPNDDLLKAFTNENQANCNLTDEELINSFLSIDSDSIDVNNNNVTINTTNSEKIVDLNQNNLIVNSNQLSLYPSSKKQESSQEWLAGLDYQHHRSQAILKDLWKRFQNSQTSSVSIPHDKMHLQRNRQQENYRNILENQNAKQDTYQEPLYKRLWLETLNKDLKKVGLSDARRKVCRSTTHKSRQHWIETLSKQQKNDLYNSFRDKMFREDASRTDDELLEQTSSNFNLMRQEQNINQNKNTSANNNNVFPSKRKRS